MRISDWSSDVCSSDLAAACARDEYIRHDDLRSFPAKLQAGLRIIFAKLADHLGQIFLIDTAYPPEGGKFASRQQFQIVEQPRHRRVEAVHLARLNRKTFGQRRSEEHTSELQSLMRISYAVFCLKTK